MQLLPIGFVAAPAFFILEMLTGDNRQFGNLRARFAYSKFRIGTKPADKLNAILRIVHSTVAD